MGHQRETRYDSAGYSDVTGSGYAVGREPDHVAGVALEARLRARAAAEACDTVQAQAIVALKEHGYSVRRIAGILDLSKSRVGRELRRAPHRAMPLPEVDQAVAQVWEDGLTRERSRRRPREGDLVRQLAIELNILADYTRQAEADEAASDGGRV